MNPERRILKETLDLEKDPVPGIVVRPDADNMRYFTVDMSGPPDSPYAGGIFEIELFLPRDYPMVPPQVRFITKIYHPNVDKLGRICLDVLKERWTPALQIRTVLLSIQALLGAPNPASPFNNEVADMWKRNEQTAKDIAKEWTRNFAARGANAKENAPSDAKPPEPSSHLPINNDNSGSSNNNNNNNKENANPHQ